MDTILVASDLSERADRALARAFRIARARAGRVVIASVVDDSLPDPIATTLARDMRDRLTRFAESLAGTDAVGHEVRVLAGDPAPAIAALAGETGAGLLVLGLHRPRPLLDAFRETTMERIVRLAACPVLLVRDPADHDYERVLAGIDFSPASAAALAAAAKVAPGAAVTCLHALHVPFKGLTGGSSASAAPFRHEAEAEQAAWQAREKPDLPAAGVEIIEGSPAQVIATGIAAIRPDLLALGAHSRAGLGALTVGGIAAMLMRDPPVDLLIARPGKAR